MIKGMFTKIWCVSTIVLLIYSCSSKPHVQKLPMHSDVKLELSLLEDQINFARQSQLNAISPNNFLEAIEAFESAKNSYANGKDKDRILNEIALSKAYLQEARKISTLAHENIEQVINARKSAIELGAPLYFKNEWSRADRDLTNLTAQLENQNTKNIEARKKSLLNNYMDLELKSIKHNNLAEIKDMISQAKNANAKKYVPLTLEKAEKSVSNTEDFITTNRYDTQEIMKRVSESKKLVLDAINLNQIAQSSTKLSNEERALVFGHNKNTALNNFLSDEVNLAQSSTIRNKTVNSYLEEKRDFQKMHKIIQDDFNEDVVDLFEQEDDSIFIRMRGLKFENGKASINNQGKELIKKLRDSLDVLPGYYMVIEGHSDQSGIEKNNIKLSKQRANSVKKVFVQNGLSPDNIETVGYGSEYPNMNNNSIEGRDANRRVDIIIRPIY